MKTKNRVITIKIKGIQGTFYTTLRKYDMFLKKLGVKKKDISSLYDESIIDKIIAISNSNRLNSKKDIKLDDMIPTIKRCN